MNGCKIYVGNLPFRYGDDDLSRLLQDMGYDFTSARVVCDRETGRSRGFAFVEFRTPQAATEAIGNLDGHVVDGRTLRVSEASEKQRPGRGAGRGGERAPTSRFTPSYDDDGFDWGDP